MGGHLIKGIKGPIEISQIKDYKEIPQGVLATNASCYSLGFKRRPVMTMFLLVNFAPIFGCVDMAKSRTTGEITKCHIYYPKGWNFILKHEQWHCRGYTAPGN